MCRMAVKTGTFVYFFTLTLQNIQKYYLIHSKTIKYFKGNLDGAYPAIVLEDTFRSINGEDADGTTYPGVCKIDYVFASTGNQVNSATIDRGNYGPASDHWPINAIIKV